MFGLKANKTISSAGTVMNEVPAAAVSTPRKLNVRSYLDTSVLSYTDYGEDYAFYPWVAENISDPSIEPVVDVTNFPIISYNESIKRVLNVIASAELPEDFVADTTKGYDTDNKSGSVEVTIL